MRYWGIILLISVSCFSQAQDIEIINALGRTYHGGLSEEIVAPIKIRNNSDAAVYVFVKRIDDNIGSTQSTNFCWGDECFDKEVNKLPVSKKIESGETVESFLSVLQAGLVSGFSTVKYQVYTRSNPSLVIEHEITYVVEDKERSNTLYSSEELILNEVYPNPVKEYAFIDYQINNSDTETKIVIHNVLGSEIGDFVLNPLEKELKIPVIEYNPGVYFYTLYIDGDGVITKKLVIRR
ncbi:MAG: T9SS type A sorting domain-containing protein [Cyclobacteriaceae bacterium]|nr:T9SS type A sorting domain-containing protein [Cyclobacteriaceae bacterium]